MTRYLLIDAGNTWVKWAEASVRGPIHPCGQVETRKVTAQRVAALARKYPRHRVVIASVVPKSSRLLRRSFRDAVFLGGSRQNLPLSFAYPRPAEIGADRLAAAIAAKGRSAAIVVSCGTATAFSVVDKRGRFCGGAIAPGLAAQLSALIGATAQLPAISPGPAKRALAKSTHEAIRAGAMIGYQGGVREIVERLRKELGTPARVVITGGAAEHLRGMRGLGRAEFRPLLVFEGLRIMARTLFGP
jgi:type III pantothenate kinase